MYIITISCSPPTVPTPLPPNFPSIFTYYFLSLIFTVSYIHINIQFHTAVNVACFYMSYQWVRGLDAHSGLSGERLAALPPPPVQSIGGTLTRHGLSSLPPLSQALFSSHMPPSPPWSCPSPETLLNQIHMRALTPDCSPLSKWPRPSSCDKSLFMSELMSWA